MKNLSTETRHLIEKNMTDAIYHTGGKKLFDLARHFNANYKIAIAEFYLFLSEKILAALDDDFRTVHKIQEFCHIPRECDITVHLSDMAAERLIWMPPGFLFEAWFRIEQKPVKIWRADNGRMKADFQTGYAPPKEIKETKTGTEKIREAISSCFVGNQNNMKAKINLTPDQIKHAASQTGGQKKTAAALGIGFSTLQFKLRNDAALKAAYREGLAEYVKKNPEAKISNTQKSVVVKSVEAGKVEPVGGSFAELAAQPNHSKKDFADEFCAGFPPFPPEIIGGEIEKMRVNIAENSFHGFALKGQQERITAQIFGGSGQSKHLEFSGGGSLTLELDSNLFNMPQPERALVFQIIDLIQNYENTKTSDG